ncbi:MAG: sulfate adenylyltransferase [Anaerolineae bacterium]|nr:sulfate adenylyltransferase [Anaerolineae bacterium]
MSEANQNNTDYVGSIAPHGGTLINRLLRGDMAQSTREMAQSLARVVLSPMNISDLELIAVGALSPLTGFMGQADYKSVVDNMHLTNGLPWTIPVTLAVDEATADKIEVGQTVALAEPDGDGTHLMGVLEVSEKYGYDKEVEAEKVYKTTEDAHPGVANVYKQGDVLLGGDIWVFDLPNAAKTEFPELRHTPAQTRRMFAQNGWRRIVAFQTRNPIHRAHEYIQKTALEIVDGLLVHPLVGETKADDIPADVRIQSYEAILRDYYPADRVMLGVFPAAMRYAGPREAIFHAIARKNYGCTHFIVGRDHAGVGGYYGTYDAQLIFDEFDRHLIDITPLMFEHAFFCKKCQMVVTAKTCPHDREEWVFLSGTQVREKLANGEMLPEEFTRPEVSKVLVEGVKKQKEEKE